MEVFQAAADDNGGVGGSKVVKGAEMQWEKDAEGFWRKDLYSDPTTGKTAMLMKVDAGAFADNHAHDNLEQIYVIEGSFYDQDGTYQVGDYVVRQPGTVHRTGSENGAVCFLTFG